jgi:signal transduction histidine kinase
MDHASPLVRLGYKGDSVADVGDAITDGRIRFTPEILRRLGEELNPNIDQGILELVKNAYDADATECHIWLDAGLDGETVVVEDDGTGMDVDGIVNGWLVLGSSQKSTTRPTLLGRTPAGNKGLGRLAALRLGHSAVLTSRPRGREDAYRVELDWDEFDRAPTVDDVAVQIAVTDASLTHGTRIELANLRKRIGRVDARRLARALVLLADPFADGTSSFRPHLHSVEFKDLAQSVERRYFDDAEFHLIARLVDGRAEAQVVDFHGNILWRARHEDLAHRNGRNLYTAPDVQFDLWVYILSQANFQARQTELKAVREWLGHFGGVHAYWNGLRVAPYGNPGNDWLDINLARAQSPEFRPSTNTSIGRIKIVDPDGRMVQKTDRSGFIEDDAYDAIRRFAKDALDWMARRRLDEREAMRTTTKKTAKVDTDAGERIVREQITRIADEEQKQLLEKAFTQYERARNLEQEALQREVLLYRTLATAGITAATFAHELDGNSLKRIYIATSSLDYMAKKIESGDGPMSLLVRQIRGAADSLGVLSAATLGLIDSDKRRQVKVLLDEVVQEVSQIFRPFLEFREVALELNQRGPGAPFIRGSRAAVESIITNLLNNALVALERADIPDRKIQVTSEVRETTWILQVADNGPGIDLPLNDIWLPGETTRVGGTGLGLTIVRDSVADLNGTVSAIAKGDFGGAVFTIQLPLLGVEDEWKLH